MPRGTVRRARPSDSKAFLSLLRALAEYEHLEPPEAGARRRIVSDIFAKKRLNLFMAESGGRPVGYALYFYTYSSFLARPTLYLEDLFVLEEARGSGLGKALFLACVKEALREGCGRMEWSVLTWNERAISFYEGLGARRLEEWAVYRLTAGALRRLGHG